MVEESKFDFPPPEIDYGGGYVPSNENYAYKLRLIETIHDLDKMEIEDSLKYEILCFIDKIFTKASMTNIEPFQIAEFLKEWKLKMTKMKIDYPDSITPEFFRIMGNLKMEFKLDLNSAKRGWRGDHAFETHTKARYDVRQQQEQIETIEKWKDKWRPKKRREE